MSAEDRNAKKEGKRPWVSEKMPIFADVLQ